MRLKSWTLGNLDKIERERDNGKKKPDPLAANVSLNEPCAVIWDTPRGREWYIGMTRSITDEDSLVIEYLECIDTNSSKKTAISSKKKISR